MGKFLYLYFILFLIPAALFAASGDGSLEFIANKGQWAEPFRYRVNTGNSDVYLENNTFTYVVGAPDNFVRINDQKFGKSEVVNLNFHAYKMVFVGANPTPLIEEGRRQQHYYNYYLGNDSRKWQSGIHPCYDVDYKNIYNNVDLHVSSSEGNLKYDFIVAAGTDPGVIKLRYDGAEKINLKDGKLQILTSVGTVEEMKPFAYQEVNGQQVKVFCRYKVSNNTVTYSFPDGYDKTQELIIDPTVVFATFTGSTGDNWGFTATYDAGGNFYAGGIELEGKYPITTGAFQATWGNGVGIFGNAFGCDIAISKFNSTGSSLVYATYLGGSRNEQPHSLIVDPSGNLIVAGRSYSTNFPTTAGCYDNSGDVLGDLIVTKFNAGGTALIGSTYVGGSGQDITNDTAYEFGWDTLKLKHNYGDDARSEVIVDQSGNIYVAACTRSKDFPTTPDAIKTTLSAGDVQDGVVLELNSNLTSLLWSTYLGGSDDDAAYVLSLDKAQANLFVAGGTNSGDFPGTSSGYIPNYQGSTDGFIAKFVNGPGHALATATYIGKSGYDQCYGIQIDNSNNVYAVGQTLGGTFPVTPGVYSNANSSQFIIKINSNLNTNLASTVFGSGDPNNTNISPVAFLVDTCGNVYVSGWGGDLFSPRAKAPPGTGNTFGMPISGSAGPAAQSTTDGADFYFIVLGKNLSSLLYATYMGTNGGVGEHVDGGTSRFDRSGVVYQAICGGCGKGTFPTTAGAYSTVNKGNNCNLVALKIAFDLGAVKAGFTVSPNGVACLGTPFTVTNTSVNGINFTWDFGDGFTTSANTPPPHTYTSVGTYIIKLRASNPNACNSVDSAKITVKVDTNSIIAAFKATVIDTCAPYTASFTNLSKLSNTPAGTVFNWSFGDGGTFTGANPPNHNYPGGGTFTVKLLMTDPAACNSPDSSSTTVTFRDDVVKASFDVQPLICLGDSFAPSNTSEKALTYLWKFGDNSTSTLARPFHKFDAVGTYKVTLYAYNPETCNKVDSTSKTIEVKPSPVADFSFTPTVPVTNEISRFTNLSKNAVSYNWDFGDGTGTEEENPEHFYKRTGTYTVCLVAMNKEGCTDTTCKSVPADILPLADIPNAFSPNGDGNNDVLFVFGAAIEKIDLKIYNRWGQLVFESHDIKNGWDGTFKGKPQEVEAYAYVLNVTFIDETTLFKKGNVTLLR